MKLRELNQYIFDAPMRPKHKLILLCMVHHTTSGLCFVSYRDMATFTGLDLATIRRSVQELVDNGFIAIYEEAAGCASRIYSVRSETILAALEQDQPDLFFYRKPRNRGKKKAA